MAMFLYASVIATGIITRRNTRTVLELAVMAAAGRSQGEGSVGGGICLTWRHRDVGDHVSNGSIVNLFFRYYHMS